MKSNPSLSARMWKSSVLAIGTAACALALARAGYYDALSFDHVRHDVSDDEKFKGEVLDLIEGGGPLGADEIRAVTAILDRAAGEVEQS